MALRINFRKKQQASGKNAYIYCRITLNGMDATDFSTLIQHSEKWDQQSQMFVGRGDEFRDQNDRLSEIVDDIKILLKELKRGGNPTASDLRNTYVKQAERKTVVQIFADHLAEIKANFGAKGFSRGTLRVHKTHTSVLKAFLSYQGRNDIDLLEIRQTFGQDFVKWMRQIKKYHQNYIVRNLNHLKGRLDQAVLDGYLTNNPLSKLHEKKLQPGPISYLSENELDLFNENRELLTPGLQRVADAFVFQCFTGFAYCDLKRFSVADHVREIQGRKVIQYSRQKSETPFTIPLLKQSASLIEKYNGNIPILSNQKMNTYIKVVAKTIGIDKHVTTHLGRKTAGTYLLNNDVPMTTVSKILGHKSVKTTEKVYAFLLEETIMRHTAHLV